MKIVIKYFLFYFNYIIGTKVPYFTSADTSSHSASYKFGVCGLDSSPPYNTLLQENLAYLDDKQVLFALTVC